MSAYKKILKFIELSKWFNRKSQHYILGNWLEYTDNWDYKNGRFDWKRLKYQIGYPKAWCKFMWYSRHDIFNA